MGQNMMRLFSQVWKNPSSSSLKDSAGSYHHLISRLKLTPEQRLMLDSIPMVLFPRWFFVSIKQQIEEKCDLETARQYTTKPDGKERSNGQKTTWKPRDSAAGLCWSSIWTVQGCGDGES